LAARSSAVAQQQQDGKFISQGSQQPDTPLSAVGNPPSSGSRGSDNLADAAAPQLAAGSSNTSDVAAAGTAKGSKRPGNGVPNLPGEGRPIGPRPPCNSSRGFEERGGLCVCMPGAAVWGCFN
jgi:hypothetical protein